MAALARPASQRQRMNVHPQGFLDFAIATVTQLGYAYDRVCPKKFPHFQTPFLDFLNH